MNAQDILHEIRPLGRDSYKRVMLKHGAREPIYGVKIEDLKKIQKRVKKDYRLAMELFETGVYDAMYLAGLIADDAQMTREDLERWLRQAPPPIAGSTVAWVAAGSSHGWELALAWIDSPMELTAATGWATLASLVSIKPDADLDLPALQRLLERVQRELHQAPDCVRYQMNDFVISAGCSVAPLTASALEIGEKIGPVMADLGDNDCRVPFAPDSIRKVQARGTIGEKAQEREVLAVSAPR